MEDRREMFMGSRMSMLTRKTKHMFAYTKVRMSIKK